LFSLVMRGVSTRYPPLENFSDNSDCTADQIIAIEMNR